MRPTAVLKVLVAGAFVAFVAVAFFDPPAFAGVRDHAGQNPLWLVLGLLAAGCGAKLTLAVPAFGAHAHLSAPLFLALAVPYFLRLMVGGAVLRVVTARFRSPSVRTPPIAAKRPRPYPAGAPAAFPDRVAVALMAAARARK